MLQTRVRGQGEAKGATVGSEPCGTRGQRSSHCAALAHVQGSSCLPDTSPPLQITVAFHSDGFKVKLPDGYQLSFPNRMGYSHLSYLSVQGGLLLSSFKLD